ncbi:MAG: DNA polymerase III subunit delta [Paracoccaceae bacterium]|nr:DNA polymerase III subunit delta [Paracoccaceae bacterium]
MKLNAQTAASYFAKPDPSKTGLLIYGADAMRVALRRQEVIRALIGPNGEDEMRLTRIAAGDLRKDPALLLDGVKAQGFFAGPRAVFVEDASDGLAEAISNALKDWADGDAQIIVTAAQLAARSKLRKLFEDHTNAYAVGIYDDPPSRAEVGAAMESAGIANIDTDAMDAITSLSRALDPGDFRQVLEKIALYKLKDDTPLTANEVALSAPASTEAAVDDLLLLVSEGKAHELFPVLRRLESQGVGPVSLCISATRHFRTLHTLASDPGGPGAAIGKLRPPVFGPRRDRLQRQASDWGLARLERALALLLDTDLTLRSTATVPEIAVIERAFLRLAWLGRR